MSKNVQQQLMLAEQAFRTGNADLATTALDRVLAIAPMNSRANELKAYLIAKSGDMAGAYQLLKKATSAANASATSFYYLGKIHLEQQQYKEAIAAFRKSLSMQGDFFQGLHDLGLALSHLGRLAEAIAAYDKAASLNPRSFEVHFNRGRAFEDQGNNEAALASYEQALSLDPTHARTWLNRGNILRNLLRHGESLSSYDRALSLKRDYAEVWFNRGVLLRELKRYAEAMDSCAKALEIDADIEYCFGAWFDLKLTLCDWSNLEAAYARFFEGIGSGKKISNPFPILATPATPALVKRCNEIYAAQFSATPLEQKSPTRRSDNKIRIGYYSADFHNHATMYLLAGVLEHHDKSKFDIIGFSFGPRSEHKMRARAEAAMTQFLDVVGKTDRQVAELSRDLGIDIAVDLKGHTQDAHPGIFAFRAAPVQVNFLGYPSTMGVPFIDYLIADRVIVPEGMEGDYTETIVRLPHCYQPNDRVRKISDRVYTRADVGLPPDAFVFVCFNNNFKITPDVFDIWARLLLKVPNSVLWLFEGDSVAAANLRKEAEKRGVAANRLIFAQRMELDEHLARLRLADLFLDTFYCNAHTTASDALWTGVPVLTRLGQTFAGRVAASLLTATGLDELITHSTEEYEAAAYDLATHPEKLSALKRKLATNRLTCPLFDTASFTRDLEALFEELHTKRLAGQA